MTAAHATPAPESFKSPQALMDALRALYANRPSNDARDKAWQAFMAHGLPSRRHEDWIWSDFFDGLVKPAAKTIDVIPEFKANRGVEIALVGNKFSWPSALPDGLHIALIEDTDTNSDTKKPPLDALSTALSGSNGDKLATNLSITVSAPQSIPIILSAIDGENGYQFGKIKGVIEAGASVEIIEICNPAAHLSSIAANWHVAETARLTRHIFQAATSSSAISSYLAANLAHQARFEQNMLSFGAKWARLETHINFEDRLAEAHLCAASLVGNGHHSDVTSRITHAAQSCKTDQTHKSVIKAGGTGIFQGKFIVPRQLGQFTEAEMAHDALLLDEGATSLAKPELEIYADDVVCAHGNTCGSLDKNALFYARQRGLTESQARALITYAFIADELSNAPRGFTDAAARWLGTDNSWSDIEL